MTAWACRASSLWLDQRNGTPTPPEKRSSERGTIGRIALGPGEALNEIGALADGVNQASAEALEPTVLWVVRPGALQKLMRTDPAVAQVVTRNLARRVVHLMRLVEDLSLRPVIARVAVLASHASPSMGAAPRMPFKRMALMGGSAMLIMMAMMFLFYRGMTRKGGHMAGKMGRGHAHHHGERAPSSNTITLTIPAITCTHYRSTIEKAVGAIGGVSTVEVEVETRKAVITFAAPATRMGIHGVLTELGYPPYSRMSPALRNQSITRALGGRITTPPSLDHPDPLHFLRHQTLVMHPRDNAQKFPYPIGGVG